MCHQEKNFWYPNVQVTKNLDTFCEQTIFYILSFTCVTHCKVLLYTQQ